MKLKNIFTLSISLFALNGCNDNSNSNDCPDCIWSSSSQTLVVTSSGGVSGQETKTQYDRKNISSGALSYLEKIKIVSNETYYDHHCVFDELEAKFTIIDSNGDETEYKGNRFCQEPNDSESNYIDHYEMDTVVQLLNGKSIQSAWDTESERIEVFYNDESYVDFTRDTLPEDFKNRLESLHYVIGDKINCSDHRAYSLRVTDNSGLTREFLSQVGASCAAEGSTIEYIEFNDFTDIFVMVDELEPLQIDIEVN